MECRGIGHIRWRCDLSRTRESVDRLLWGYSGLVTAVTLFAWWTYWRKPTSTNAPLFLAQDRFHDLTNYIEKTAHLQGSSAALGRGEPLFDYLAPAAYVYKFFLHGFPRHPVLAFVVVFLAPLIFYTGLAVWKAGSQGRALSGFAEAIVTTVLLASPTWWTIDRANLEGVVWLFSAGGLCAFLARRYTWAAVLFGLATSIKPFPFLFFSLLVARRRIREAILGVSIAAVLVVTALAALGGNPIKGYRDLKPGVDLYVNGYIKTFRDPSEQRNYHSLLDGAKSLVLIDAAHSLRSNDIEGVDRKLMGIPNGGSALLGRLEDIYPVLDICFCAALIWIFRAKPILNQLTAACIAVVLVPMAPTEYNLIHLYVPAASFFIFLATDISAGRTRIGRNTASGILCCYALLFSPLSFLQMFAGDAKLILLVTLLVLVARTPLQSSSFEERDQAGVREPLKRELA